MARYSMFFDICLLSLEPANRRVNIVDAGKRFSGLGTFLYKSNALSRKTRFVIFSNFDYFYFFSSSIQTMLLFDQYKYEIHSGFD